MSYVLPTPPPSSACTCPNTQQHYALSFRFSRSCSTNLPLLQKPTLGMTILHTLTKFSHQHKEVGTSSSISHSTQPLLLSLPSAPYWFLISWPPSPVLLHGSSNTTLTSLSSALCLFPHADTNFDHTDYDELHTKFFQETPNATGEFRSFHQHFLPFPLRLSFRPLAPRSPCPSTLRFFLSSSLPLSFFLSFFLSFSIISLPCRIRLQS